MICLCTRTQGGRFEGFDRTPLFTKILINAHTDFDAHSMAKGEASFGPNLLKPVAGDRQESSPAASTVAVLAGVVVAVVVSLISMT